MFVPLSSKLCPNLERRLPDDPERCAHPERLSCPLDRPRRLLSSFAGRRVGPAVVRAVLCSRGVSLPFTRELVILYPRPQLHRGGWLSIPAAADADFERFRAVSCQATFLAERAEIRHSWLHHEPAPLRVSAA